MITRDNLTQTLLALGYKPEGEGVTWRKTWAEVGSSIVIDLGRGSIDYPENIRVNKRTTCNFSDNENFVVLAYVTRLLDKGYRPESLELEREWQLGHEQKSGRADIVVSDTAGDGQVGGTLAIIECKTPGAEYDSEWRRMLADGGQLFSYWQQERGCRWLVLATCDLDGGGIDFSQHSISCEDDENFRKLAEHDDTIRLYSGAHTAIELHAAWSETYDHRSEGDVLLGPRATAYAPTVPPLLVGDLQDFDARAGIVNKFEEILRHNNVSDKENAFNRLIALFIAKLEDELSKDAGQEVDFQYKQGHDTYETLQDRLQRLHSAGMRELMREDVLYVPDDYARRVVSRYTGQNRERLVSELEGTLRKLKFYTNNDFAFKDVHNEELFMQNGKVLVEVVQLFQPYRIVGAGDLQFLGDMFEQLLAKGFKQNEGQFFTPTPITRFIWRSLPVDEVSSDGEGGWRAPRVLDYACGAGHFLTEGFEEVSRVTGGSLPADWARGHLVGVEKDYRLARVSRVSLYMHGAGEGEIVFGDGLDNHPDKGIDGRRDSGRFDILASNPPYSVKGFKPHLQLRENELETLDAVSDDGGEIETAFVERAAQVVRPGGFAAVILPSSILDKGASASFTVARDVLLRSFELDSVVRLGSGTFAETGTNVVILFMRRFDERPTRDASARDFVDAAFDGRDLEGWEDADDYLAWLGVIGCSEEDYIDFTGRARHWGEWLDVPHFSIYARQFQGSAALRAVRRPRSYARLDAEGKAWKEDDAFYAFAHEQERERLRVFSLVHGIRTLVVNSPTSTGEMANFLGYKWSKRKGQEGIQMLDGGGLLYSEDPDGDERICDVVRSWFDGEVAEESDLSSSYYYADLQNLIDFNSDRFDETLKMPRTFYRPREFAEGVNVRTLGDVAAYVSATIPQADIDTGTYVTTDNMMKGRGGIEPYEGDAPASPGTAYRKGDTLVSNIRPYLQKIWLADRDGACSKDVLVFRTKDEGVLLPEFLHLLLWQKDFFDYDMSTFTGTGRPRGDKGQILGYRVPVPSVDIQQHLVAEFDRLSGGIKGFGQRIAASEAGVEEEFNSVIVGSAMAQVGSLLGEDPSNGLYKPQACYRVDGSGTPIVRIDSYVSGGVPRWDELKRLLCTNDEVSSYGLRDGDLLVNRVNSVPYLGKVAYVECLPQATVFESNMMRLRFKRSVVPRFVAYALSRDSVHKQVEQMAKLAAHQASINQDDVRKLTIPLPSITLQRQFADFAQQADKEQAELQKRLDVLSEERDSLLDRYLD